MSSELELDLQELQQLRAQATRPGVQASLDANVKELERKLQQAKKREQDQEAKAKQPSAVVTSAGLPKLKITTYAWDQSDKFLKIYVTVPKVETAAPDQLNAIYGTDSVSLTVRAVDGRDYEMSIVNLLNNIDVDNSFFKQKKDTVLLMLKKAKEGGKWDAVTKMDKIAADKRVPKVDEKADPQASLMSMMKHMYDDGDDEMKRSIKKAWHESQSKKGPGMGMEGFGNLDDL